MSRLPAKRLYPDEPSVAPVRLDHPPTYADIEALPPNLRGEIVNGELYVMPRPRPRHAYTAGRLAEVLGPFQKGGGGPGGWWILPEPELHLDGPGVPIDPDLAGWHRERMPRIPDEAAIGLRPDWVCEVLSPSTEAYDRGSKMATYGRHAVPHAWLVDPDERALEVFWNDASTWRPLASWRGDARVRAAPFDAIEIDLAKLWA